MKRLAAAAVLVSASLELLGCSTRPGPVPDPMAPDAVSHPSQEVALSFANLSTNGASVETYPEQGFTVSLMGTGWQSVTTYGNPAPFVEFYAPGGSTVMGTVEITSSSGFSFKSVDLYSSTTPIPYVIAGSASGSSSAAASLRISGTLPAEPVAPPSSDPLSGAVPNTFGNFRTVTNSDVATVVNKLVITLTNSASPCCQNPMGLDNVVLLK